MILKKVGNTKILCEKKDGTEKWFKATSAVIAFAKKNFKEGDSIKAEFNDKTYIIEKITKQDSEGGSFGKGGKGGSYEKMVEMSVLKSVCSALPNLKEVDTLKKAKATIIELYELGMELVSGKAEVKKEEEETSEEPEENPEPED